jgi:hypothetical protein
MLSDVQKVTTASAVIATPCISAVAFRTLTSFSLLALINVCKSELKEIWFKACCI